MYSMETCWMRMPETKDRLRPMRSIKKMAQRREAISLTAPSTAVVNSFLDWPVKPNRANNSGAYAAVCQYPYHAMIGMNSLVIEFAPDHWLKSCSEMTKSSRFWLAATRNNSRRALIQVWSCDCSCSACSWRWIPSISDKINPCPPGRPHSLPSDAFAFLSCPTLHRYRGLSSHRSDSRSRIPATMICMLWGIIHCFALLLEICNEAPHAEKYYIHQ